MDISITENLYGKMFLAIYRHAFRFLTLASYIVYQFNTDPYSGLGPRDAGGLSREYVLRIHSVA